MNIYVYNLLNFKQNQLLFIDKFLREFIHQLFQVNFVPQK